jgi:hypothetical protein
MVVFDRLLPRIIIAFTINVIADRYMTDISVRTPKI